MFLKLSVSSQSLCFKTPKKGLNSQFFFNVNILSYANPRVSSRAHSWGHFHPHPIDCLGEEKSLTVSLREKSLTVTFEDNLFQDQCDWQESSGTSVLASGGEEHCLEGMVRVARGGGEEARVSRALRG